MNYNSIKKRYDNLFKNFLKRLSLEDEKIIDYISLVENRNYNNIVTLNYINLFVSNSSRRIVNIWLLRLGFDEKNEYIVMLAHQYLDRFICISDKVNLSNYQLYALAAYSIAFKYMDDNEEDISTKSISGSRVEFLTEMTDNAFTPSQFINSEIEMMALLDYELVTVTIEDIVLFIIEDVVITNYNKKLLDILLKISVIYEISIIYKPSVIAHSIVYITIPLLKNTKQFYKLKKYSNCLKHLRHILDKTITFQHIKGCNSFYEYYEKELKELNYSSLGGYTIDHSALDSEFAISDKPPQ
jgi:hypothetical protein